MLKWVLGLCLAMYVVLLTFGEPTPEELAEREARDLQEVTRAETVAVVAATPQEQPETPAVVEPAPVVREIEAPALVSATPTTQQPAAPAPVETAVLTPAPGPAPAAAPETQPDDIASAAPVNEIWRVTAQAVNLRAGPSTNNAVVGRATFNDSAEIIEMLPTGWAKVYILESGTEAFMSARFLAAPE